MTQIPESVLFRRERAHKRLAQADREDECAIFISLLGATLYTAATILLGIITEVLQRSVLVVVAITLVTIFVAAYIALRRLRRSYFEEAELLDRGEIDDWRTSP